MSRVNSPTDSPGEDASADLCGTNGGNCSASHVVVSLAGQRPGELALSAGGRDAGAKLVHWRIGVAGTVRGRWGRQLQRGNRIVADGFNLRSSPTVSASTGMRCKPGCTVERRGVDLR